MARHLYCSATKCLSGKLTAWKLPRRKSCILIFILIMLKKEFKDEKDTLVFFVCKYDSFNGNLNYCGTLCLQVNEMNK